MVQSENTVEEYTTGLEEENKAEGSEQAGNANEKGGKRKKKGLETLQRTTFRRR